MTPQIIHAVLHEAIAQLSVRSAHMPDCRDMVSELEQATLPEGSLRPVQGCIPAHHDLLSQAISAILTPPFATLKAAISKAKADLHWRVDAGGYYADGADVGEGYRTGNMHCLLIGPKDCPILSQDVLLGLFLLAPRTLYRDHKHLASEIYLPLTGPHGWRFDLGAWRDAPAGQVIYNAPENIHATRVYDTPFLALFGWSGDIGSACSVVNADDWAKIEDNLT